jgi:shikimate dehydrogenase
VIRGATRIAAVIGWPIEHSKSPELLNAAFLAAGLDLAMIPMGVPPDAFAAAVHGLRAMRAIGASVTSPHKLAAYELCDGLSDAATAIGAVNCLHFDGDQLIGHNTDAIGFAKSLETAGCTPRHPVLLGAGGAARAVAFGLRHAGHRDVEVVARTLADWCPTTPWRDLAEALRRADLVVDCTSAGLGTGAQSFADDVPLDRLAAGSWVASLTYHHRSPLLARADALGHRTLDGRGMLVHQAARAFTIWTGRDAPLDAMQAAFTDS